MADTRPQVVLREMTLDDIDQVFSLDQMSFPTPWPLRTYRYEIEDNEHSCMFVLEPLGEPPVRPRSSRMTWWERLLGLGGASSNGNGHHLNPFLCGYSGMWHIADEAHISTIAVHPGWRGKKLGELLLWSMIRQAMLQDAGQVTLEVRVSNSLAQALYRKYNFEIMGLRKGYYRDNGEDAYMMAVMKLDEDYRAKLNGFGQALARDIRVIDRWWAQPEEDA